MKKDFALLGCDERYQFAILWRISASIFLVVVESRQMNK